MAKKRPRPPYTVRLTTEAEADIDGLEKKIRRQVVRKLDALAGNPRPPKCKRLGEADHLYRVRSGDFRILYQIQDKVLKVLVVRVGDRKNVYSRLPPFRRGP